ncbi:MAG: aspartate/glutamate racemase family protein [Clostridia bacterium]
MQKTVALIHTTAATIEPLKNRLTSLLPNVTVRSYLDDSLLPQINAQGRINEDCAQRFFLLCQSAALARPDAMLCACSSVGELVEQFAAILNIPFLRIDEPMACEAVLRGGQIKVLATMNSTLAPTLALIRRKGAGAPLRIESAVIEGAGELLSAGRFDDYKRLLRQELARYAAECNTVVLAQASMAQGLEGMSEDLQAKFLTSPASGLAALVNLLQHKE